MSIEALEYIKNLMNQLSIPYALIRWNSGEPPDPYFIGEYIENPSPYRVENGHQESTFILRGYTRKEWMGLEEAKEKIERGAMKTAILPSGNGIAIFYDYGTPVPTNNDDEKSIKINLTIQEWKVN